MKNNANFEFGVAYLPGEERFATPTGGGNFYIFKDTSEERQLASIEFIKWVTEPTVRPNGVLIQVILQLANLLMKHLN